MSLFRASLAWTFYRKGKMTTWMERWFGPFLAVEEMPEMGTGPMEALHGDVNQEYLKGLVQT